MKATAWISFVLPALAFLWGAFPIERIRAGRGLLSALGLLKGVVPAAVALPMVAEAWIGALGLDAAPSIPDMGWWVLLATVLGDICLPWFRRGFGTGVLVAWGGLAVVAPWAALGAASGAAVARLSIASGTRRRTVATLAGIFTAAATQLVLQEGGTWVWVGAILLLALLLRMERELDGLLEDGVVSSR
ncbi:MAG: hypothetical protein IT285_14645 [Bdellovibrionales bacterium]|nr:hypothetical protein [Bdellovibrionales bacterium]